jgi:hypothetical protein
MTTGAADADLDRSPDPDAFADPPGLREWAYGLGGAGGLAFCGLVWLLALPLALAAFVVLNVWRLAGLAAFQRNERLRRGGARG